MRRFRHHVSRLRQRLFSFGHLLLGFVFSSPWLFDSHRVSLLYDSARCVMQDVRHFPAPTASRVLHTEFSGGPLTINLTFYRWFSVVQVAHWVAPFRRSGDVRNHQSCMSKAEQQGCIWLG